MSQKWISVLTDLLLEISPLVQSFDASGYKIYAVGGVVRESLLGVTQVDDIDLTTDALPNEIKSIMSPLVESLWNQGERFGTIGGIISGLNIEVTTHRAEKYTTSSRKPEVEFGTSILDDLSRRDFTINAIAVSLPDLKVVDPFNGINDLQNKQLKTPLKAAISFADDPLRMFRAARF